MFCRSTRTRRKKRRWRMKRETCDTILRYELAPAPVATFLGCHAEPSISPAPRGPRRGLSGGYHHHGISAVHKRGPGRHGTSHRPETCSAPSRHFALSTFTSYFSPTAAVVHNLIALEHDFGGDSGCCSIIMSQAVFDMPQSENFEMINEIITS